ncbi:MAG: rRNA maturation RNase YbeY [Syntrophobacterales bacterium]|nr:rRNA maturation RNase YbeY [Syntrophobacterales bacterium]
MIQNAQLQQEINLQRLEKSANHILDALGCDGIELSILLTDDDTIRDLKFRYMGIDEPTDVLAFPMEDPLSSSENRLRMLGDVVISVTTASNMAREKGYSLEMIMDLLLVHGILHLLGYDHSTPEEASTMDTKTLELLLSLGYDPSLWTWYLTENEGSKGE